MELDVSGLLAALKDCTSQATKEDARSVSWKLVKLQSLEFGMVIHSGAKPLLCSQSFVASALVDMYSKCGSMDDARRVFDGLTSPDAVSWTALITGFALNRNPEECLHALAQMQQQGCTPNARTFAASLKACIFMAETYEGEMKLRALETGMAVHSQAARAGCDKNLFVAASLVGFYSKAGRLDDARRVFERVAQPDVVLWNVFISGLAENGEGSMALDAFSQMRDWGCVPNGRSYVAAVKACTRLASEEAGEQVDGKLVKVISLEKAMALHRQAASSGYDMESFVATSMVDMYAKCGSLLDACRVFERSSSDSRNKHNLVLWNSIIQGCAENGEGKLGFTLFQQMRLKHQLQPDARTYAGVLKACSNDLALPSAKKVDADIHRHGFESDPVLVTCRVDVYGRCGDLAFAQIVFDGAVNPVVENWTALMAAYSQQGEAERVFELFQGMQEEGIKPNEVTLVCVLSACDHSGLVDKGRRLFDEAMGSRFGFSPWLEHYHCMVDMLGRASELESAIQLVKRMPWTPNARTWTTLLDASKKKKNSLLSLGQVHIADLKVVN